MRNAILTLLFLVSICSSTFAHALKLSTCFIRYDQHLQQASVGINFFWDDFSYSVFKEKQVQLNEGSINESQKKIIKQYIQQQLSISFNGRKKLVITNIKLTENILHIDAHIEKVKYISKESDITIKNTLMLAEYRSQMNLVKIDLEGKKNYHVLNFNSNTTRIRKVY